MLVFFFCRGGNAREVYPSSIQAFNYLQNPLHSLLLLIRFACPTSPVQLLSLTSSVVSAVEVYGSTYGLDPSILGSEGVENHVQLIHGA